MSRAGRSMGAGALLAGLLTPPAFGQAVADGELAWRGSADHRTEPFTVPAGGWRLRWELGSPPGFVPRLQIWVHPVEGPASVRAVVNQEGVGHGSSEPLIEPGTYFLEVLATNADWVVSIETGHARAERAGPETALTQACVGSSVPAGRASVFGGAGFTDGSTSYSLGVTQNPEGVAGYGIAGTYVDFDDLEEAGYGVSVAVALEALTNPVGICPVGGVGYSRIEDFDADFWTFPIGVGVGASLGEGTGVRVVPYAVPQFLILHARGFGETETETEAALDVGLTISGTTFFGTFDVGITSVDESDPTFAVIAGVVF